MFADQVAHLKNRYRVITYDHRGQGQSEVTASGYDMDALTDDALALITALGIGLCNVVKLLGTRPVTGAVMKIMFGQKFLNDNGRKNLRNHWIRELQKNKRSIVRAVYGVTNRKGVEAELPNIKCPTLIIVGDQDVATVPDKARFINSKIIGSQLVIIPGAGHSSSVEEPDAINLAVDAFLAVK